VLCMKCVQFQKVSTLASNAIPVTRLAIYTVGCSVRVGTSGLTVVTAFRRSSTTCFPLATCTPDHEEMTSPYLRAGLLADLLDLLKLLVGGFLCVLLGLLVAAGVLFVVSCCPRSNFSHSLSPLNGESMYSKTCDLRCYSLQSRKS